MSMIIISFLYSMRVMFLPMPNSPTPPIGMMRTASGSGRDFLSSALVIWAPL